jgi:hypothetical protein
MNSVLIGLCFLMVNASNYTTVEEGRVDVCDVVYMSAAKDHHKESMLQVFNSSVGILVGVHGGTSGLVTDNEGKAATPSAVRQWLVTKGLVKDGEVVTFFCCFPGYVAKKNKDPLVKVMCTHVFTQVFVCPNFGCKPGTYTICTRLYASETPQAEAMPVEEVVVRVPVKVPVKVPVVVVPVLNPLRIPGAGASEAELARFRLVMNAAYQAHKTGVSQSNPK